MEMSLHRALKERYATGGDGRSEVVVGRFRIDAVDDMGRLIEVQSGPLGPLAGKLRRLLPDHRMRIVKPVVLTRRVVRKSRLDGPDLSSRRSPKRGALLDVFDDLIGVVRLFPHSNLDIEVLGVTIDEVRVPRRRWPGYTIADRRLGAIHETTSLASASDLWALLPASLRRQTTVHNAGFGPATRPPALVCAASRLLPAPDRGSPRRRQVGQSVDLPARHLIDSVPHGKTVLYWAGSPNWSSKRKLLMNQRHRARWVWPGTFFVGMLVVLAASPTAAIRAQEAMPATRSAGESLNSPLEPFAPVFSLSQAAVALDESALSWIHLHRCGSCHTTYSYLVARPAFKETASPALDEVRRFFEERVAHWDDKDKAAKPRWDAEVVSTAEALALNDAATTGKLHPLTRKALDRMWTLQKPEGASNGSSAAGPHWSTTTTMARSLPPSGLVMRPTAMLKAPPRRQGSPGSAPISPRTPRLTFTTRRCCSGPRPGSTA